MTAKLGLFAVFAKLAEAPAPQTGAWRILTEDGREGMVLMESGRICWANDELVGRLSDEIERRFGVNRTAIEQVIRACRETGQPFGAALVEQGFLSQHQLAQVLREHICRSIISMVKSGVRDCAWIPHQGAGYAPETTISVTQAACRCVALVKRAGGERLEAALEAMVAGDAVGMLIDTASRLPLAASTAAMTWPELRRWLSWAMRADDVCPLPSHGYSAGRGHAGGWVMWRAGTILGIAVTTSEDAQRRMLLRVSSTITDWTVT